MPRIASGHHVHWIEHLLCELGDIHGAVVSSDAASPGERAFLVMKKWRRGNGTMFTESFLRSALSWPGHSIYKLWISIALTNDLYTEYAGVFLFRLFIYS